MAPLDPDVIVAVAPALAPVVVAALQLVLCRWRDLGPLTVTAAGLAVVLIPPGPVLWGSVAATATVASIGWARGASRGVGHPALDGLAVGFAVLAGAVVAGWPVDEVRAAAAASLGVVGAVETTLSLRRPGARHPGVRWVGEIPIGTKGAR